MSIRNYLKRWTADAFNAWSTDYEQVATTKLNARGYSYSCLAAEILACSGWQEGSTLLEVGTGPGTLGIEIRAQSKATLVGIDVSSGMLRQALDKDVYALLTRANAEHLPFGADTFDGLFAAFVFHSVFDQSQALREIHRVLKPGGTAALIDLCPIGRPHWLALLLGWLHSAWHERGALSCYAPVEKYLKKALEVGFVITRVKPLGIKKRYSHYLIALEKEGT